MMVQARNPRCHKFVHRHTAAWRSGRRKNDRRSEKPERREPRRRTTNKPIPRGFVTLTTIRVNDLRASRSRLLDQPPHPVRHSFYSFSSVAAAAAARLTSFSRKLSIRTTPLPTCHSSLHSWLTNASLWEMVTTPPLKPTNAFVSAARVSLSSCRAWAGQGCTTPKHGIL